MTRIQSEFQSQGQHGQVLLPLSFPLHGSRLIEASAGTGKTWTIAALYVRLVLGHGTEHAFSRPLHPAEIVVMTFTRAATKELSGRIRDRLVEAAGCFRGQSPYEHDSFLRELIAAYPEGEVRSQAAFRLMLAAQSMDEAAVFTIDAWCQRMLREHAFDSGSLFDEELVSDQSALFEHAVRDYWRQQVYALSGATLATFTACWPDVSALEQAVAGLIKHADFLAKKSESVSAGCHFRLAETLEQLITRLSAVQATELARIKQGWPARIDTMERWLAEQWQDDPKKFSGVKLKPATVAGWFSALRNWVRTPDAVNPDAAFSKAWQRLSPDGLTDACNKNKSVMVPDDFDALVMLQAELAALEPIRFSLLKHAVLTIARRMDEIKQRHGQFGFDDMLRRLKNALEGENGTALRDRILRQYPVALIDEFQDTSPDQYAIFNALYQVKNNDVSHGLFLIGDPKQSIYGFRGADIHSYLSARKATEGRHYVLATNFRSTYALVKAVNTVFEHAEGNDASSGFSGGAFRFRTDAGNPLPFEAVGANGRSEHFSGADSTADTVDATGIIPALTFWCVSKAELNKEDYLSLFAAHSAERIVRLLNDPSVGFYSDQGFVRLQAADIAILVRDRHEALAIRQALQRRQVASVYLSDKDSVIQSAEAADVLRWLQAVAMPLDGTVARAAFATPTIGLSLAELARLAADDIAWETRVEQLKDLHVVWQRQGVLAMLRRFIHELGLPARLLTRTGGERCLTNLLHLAELVQSASEQLDGEQALIRWLSEQIEQESGAGDERILRLESDAELVKVCTVHKSKGLEYPLVFLPFAVSARPASSRNRSYLEFVDAAGVKHIDFAMSKETLAAMEAVRLEEDLRLLYVALTRARHAVWLGVASLKNKIHESALGYLLAGGQAVSAEQLAGALAQLKGDCDAIAIENVVSGVSDGAGDNAGDFSGAQAASVTLLSRKDERPALIDAPEYQVSFERDWSVGSFSSLTRAMQVSGIATSVMSMPVAGSRIQDNKLCEDDDMPQSSSRLFHIPPSSRVTQHAPWHHFPRGPLPGQFLHEQLEWLVNEGLALLDTDSFHTRLAMRCEHAGWGHRQEETGIWLRRLADTVIMPLGIALRELAVLTPEMEFWFPSERLRSRELDRLCQQHLPGTLSCSALPERELHGLLMGFADLVFEHQGKYWVLDYKSNFIGPDDASYHKDALMLAMTSHRYDVQGAVYMLALHRLLKSRLGVNYDPDTQLGGAIFFFLRGLEHPETHGCYHMAPSGRMMDELDRLFSAQSPVDFIAR